MTTEEDFNSIKATLVSTFSQYVDVIESSKFEDILEFKKRQGLIDANRQVVEAYAEFVKMFISVKPVIGKQNNNQ